MAAPLAVLLDVNETLSDLTALRRRLVSAGAPPHLLERWFTATLRDGISLALHGDFATFDEVGTSLLAEMLVHESSVEGDPRAVAEHVVAAFATVDVHRDVEPGLRRLRDADVRLVTLTNGAAANTEAMLRRAGLLDLVEHRLDVSVVRRWKPAPEAYVYAVGFCGLRPEQVALVASHPWDVDGAVRAGLVGAYLRRGATRYPPFMRQPAVRASTLPELASALLAL